MQPGMNTHENPSTRPSPSCFSVPLEQAVIHPLMQQTISTPPPPPLAIPSRRISHPHRTNRNQSLPAVMQLHLIDIMHTYLLRWPSAVRMPGRQAGNVPSKRGRTRAHPCRNRVMTEKRGRYRLFSEPICEPYLSAWLNTTHLHQLRNQLQAFPHFA